MYNNRNNMAVAIPSAEDRRTWAKEQAYLRRMADLMGTDAKTLGSYAKLKLWEEGENYQKVVKYVDNSQCHGDVRLTVVNIHRVWRKGDEENLHHLKNRMFLWHGTKRGNIPNILNTGFLLPRGSGGVTVANGSMFGTGIYFADRITKSSNYCDQDKTFLLLCEVGLGNSYSCRVAHTDWTNPPLGYDNVKGNGQHVPDWTDHGKYWGSKIPFGKTAKCTKYSSHSLVFNEYILYDPSRIIIRFLVEVEVRKLDPPLPLQLVVPGNAKGSRTFDSSRPRNTGPSTAAQSSSLAQANNQANLLNQHRILNSRLNLPQIYSNSPAAAVAARAIPTRIPATNGVTPKPTVIVRPRINPVQPSRTNGISGQGLNSQTPNYILQSRLRQIPIALPTSTEFIPRRRQQDYSPSVQSRLGYGCCCTIV